MDTKDNDESDRGVDDDDDEKPTNWQDYTTPPHDLQSSQPILMEQRRKRRLGVGGFSRFTSSSDIMEPRCINFDDDVIAATNDDDDEDDNKDGGGQSQSSSSLSASSASNCYDEPCCQRIRCSSPPQGYATPFDSATANRSSPWSTGITSASINTATTTASAAAYATVTNIWNNFLAGGPIGATAISVNDGDVVNDDDDDTTYEEDYELLDMELKSKYLDVCTDMDKFGHP